MLTNDSEKMINEAFRVLKPGGQAVFSIWGKKQDTHYFDELRTLLERVTGKKSNKTNFDLHDNIDRLRLMVDKAGFRKEYTNCLIDVYDTKDYYERFRSNMVEKTLEKIDKEKADMFNNEMTTILSDFEKSDKFVNLNVMVFSVFKPEK